MIWLLTACLLWGPSFGLVPIIMGKYGVDPHTLAALRMGYAFLMFLPLIRPRKHLAWKRLALTLLGGLQFGVMYVLLFMSYKHLAGYEVALVTIFTPIYVSLLGHALNKSRIHLRPFACVLIAVLGAGVIRYARPEQNGFWTGFLLMQGCNLSFALGQIVYRKLMHRTERFEDAHVFGWMYLGAWAVTLVNWLSQGQAAESLMHLRTLPAIAWIYILWLGLIPSGLAFFLFNHGSLKVDEDTLAIVNNLKIPIALLIVLLIFQQGSTIENWGRFIFGSTLMLLALWWNNKPCRLT